MTDVRAMTVEVAVAFDAHPAAVWDVLTDVERMAGLGPEHLRARWLTPGPAVDARFRGWNRLDETEWEVVCVVTACRVPEYFEWHVGEGPAPSSTWSYRLSPQGERSTLVTQRFVHGPGRSGVTERIERQPGRAEEIVAARTAMLRTNMLATLEAAAKLVAPPPSAPGHR